MLFVNIISVTPLVITIRLINNELFFQFHILYINSIKSKTIANLSIHPTRDYIINMTITIKTQ